MKKAVLGAWILWTLLQTRTPSGSIARSEWTMGRTSETRAECEAMLVEAVRQAHEWAATRAKELQSEKGRGDVTAQYHPNSVFLITKAARTEKRAECWPVGADPRGLTR